LGLRNPQHERFALLVGSGQEPKPAWGEAFGRAPKGKEADALAADPDVAIRIREVQARAVELVLEESVCSRVWLLDKLREAIEKSIELRKLATAIRGIELAGKLPELRLFPSETRVHHTKDRFADMSDAQILEFAKKVGLVKPPEPERIVEGTDQRVEEADGSAVH
jgi:hypothetical protein